MSSKRERLYKTLAVMLALTAASPPLIISVVTRPTLAQSSEASTSFPVPQTVPSGTEVQLNGSTSMTKLNEALTERFKSQFPGTDVRVAYEGTDAALKALLNDEIDIAAIGRPLTDAETAQGLVATPLTRDKIALIVAPENQFKESLTIDEFAKIFRGEITDWSEVGGSPGTIKMIDRPETSDTRRAFQNYPVFQNAPLETGTNAVTLSEDTTQAVIEELGTDGIGYAIAGQVVDNPDVRILPMHEVPVTDANYPFSQPLLYVYKGTNPSSAAQAFLGYAQAPENQQTIEQAVVTSAITATTLPKALPPTGSAASPGTTTNTPESPPTTGSEVVPSETTTTAPESPSAFVPDTTERTATQSQRGFPWWPWLLLIPILGGLLWWLLKGRGSPAGTAVAPVAAPIATRDSRIILTPRNCRDAYAYWEIPDEVKENLQKHGKRQLKLRLYDVTDIEMDSQIPHSVKEFDCDAQEQDLHLPIAVDDRDYIAELGHGSENDRWIKIARSDRVRVPACQPTDKKVIPTVGAAVGATAAGAAIHSLGTTGRRRAVEEEDTSRVILVPRNDNDMYAYWEISEERKAQLRQEGADKMALRVYDATGVDLDREPAHSVQQYECDEQTQDLHVSIPESNRDYVAELGYLTADERWLKLARSAPVRVEPTIATDSVTEALPSLNIKTPETTQPINPKENVGQTASSWVEDATKTVSNLTGVTKAAGTVVTGGTTTHSFLDKDESGYSERTSTASTYPIMERDCRIILVPRNSQAAYAYWEVSDDYKVALRNQGGRKLMLRVHDVTNLDIDHQSPHNTQEYECDENEQDKYVSIPASNRDYIAELGYYTEDGRWLRIIRSFHVHIPSDSASF
jgi:phosphate transport system substrate-binding protein